jgi:hypothetical protein
VCTVSDQWTHFTDAIVTPTFAHVDATTTIFLGQFDGQFVATLAITADGSETVASSSI